MTGQRRLPLEPPAHVDEHEAAQHEQDDADAEGREAAAQDRRLVAAELRQRGLRLARVRSLRR